MSNDMHGHSPNEQDFALAARARAVLCAMTATEVPVTYRVLAKQLALAPPNTIHQLTTALEILMREDAKAGAPMIAALVTSRWRGGLPAPGFFALATALGRHDGAETGQSAADFHARELAAARAHWLQTPTAL